MNRKVLFVHDGPIYYEPDSIKYYGVHYNDELINRYLYFGSQISFLMRKKEVDYATARNLSQITESNFSFIEIPNFKSIKTFFKNNIKARKIIKEQINNYDIIIIRLPSAAGSIALKYAKKMNKPVLIEFVSCVFDALWNYDLRGKLIAHYKLFKYKKIMKQANHTIYVTNQFLQYRYPAKGKSISCSNVELPPLSNDILRKRLEKIQNHEGIFVLCTIAALDVPYKGQADVIKALGKLKKKGIFFKYILIGQGKHEKIKKIIEKNDVEDLVEIVGTVFHNKIFQLLKGVNVYIQPSRTEGLPRAVLEAMSMACPCLGSRVGGIPELLDGSCLFAPGDVNKIMYLLSGIDKNWLLINALRNFTRALEYQKPVLDAKRQSFYREFLCDYGLNS